MNRRFQVVLVVCVTLLVLSSAALAVIDDADQLYVGPGETYTLGGSHSYGVSVGVAATGILYVTAYNGGVNTGYLELDAPVMIIDGTIDGAGCGYRGATTTHGAGEGPGGGGVDGAGGGYGGAGGASGWGVPGGPAYGTTSGHDIQMGSGGGKGTTSAGNGGNGGGMVSLVATDLTICGLITVDGDPGLYGSMDGGGAGSGGGIYLNAADITLSGGLAADGGAGGGSGGTRKGGGGGGGGRLKIFYCTILYTGTMTRSGGAGGVAGTNGQPGSAGTSYSLIVDEPVITSIVDVGNDQGRQVRITWNRACPDDPGVSDPVTHYTIWRRIDEVRSAGEDDGNGRLYPPGDWDFVLDMPARGEDQYNAVVPTLADSNAGGMHWSVFFVSGVTDDPFVYYDSAPDSGYSVDNLAPAPPAAFLLTRVGDTNEMVWLESPEEDFAYYSLHRGEDENFLPDASNLIDTLIETEYDDDGPILSFYKLAAVDFNGNVSVYALAVPDVAGVDDGSFFLSLRVASPAGDDVAVEFVLPTSAPATLGLYDVAGRLVAEQEIGLRSPGRYTASLASRESLASGVYFVQLDQGGSTKAARVVVVK